MNKTTSRQVQTLFQPHLRGLPFPLKMLPGFVLLICLCMTGQAVFAEQSANEWKDAEHLYERTCAYCHELGVGPYLKGRKLPSAYFKLRLRAGFRAMPAFKPSEISDSDADMLGKWLEESKAEEQHAKGAQYRPRPPK